LADTRKGQIVLQNNSALKSKIDQLWDKFWSGGISNPITAIEQIAWRCRISSMDRDAEWE
jgi:type I restriction enzyme M protein